MAVAFFDSAEWIWFMKIYLAGGMTVINVIGRERDVYKNAKLEAFIFFLFL